eukprot:scpid70570/ scgid6159/ Ankyrin repeat domain-containing protein 39
MADHSDHCCGAHGGGNSASQTLDELSWERGIWAAALNQDDQRLRHLLRSGTACADQQDVSGYCALHYACRAGHLSTCRILVTDFSANVNCRTRSSLATPLHRAAFAGHLAIVELLLVNKADPHIVDDTDKNCLHKACEGGHASVCRLLLKHHPSLATHPDKRGVLPWQCLPPGALPDLCSELKC